jgi:hypothetical protein
MKLRNLARAFLRVLAALAMLALVIVLDWYPTVKELGRLRRERSDMERKVKEYAVMASRFFFPDAEERALFTSQGASLLRSLPRTTDDPAWLKRSSSWLRRQAGTDGVADLLALSTPAPGGAMDSGALTTSQAPAAWWLAWQRPDMQESLHVASDWSRLPWRGVFDSLKFSKELDLASRSLAIAIEGRLPALLDFINHSSAGGSRLEIVRLRLEPVAGLYRAWIILRGYYLVRKPSAWAVKIEPGNGGNDLLIDHDSPMLWQKVDPGSAYRIENKELPTASSWKPD